MFFRKKQTKVFEDYFTELQADMVSICVEYVENYADMIYIYCSCEPNVMAADVFFKVNGTCVRKHQLNEAPGNHPEYTTTLENQQMVLEILMGDLKGIQQVCEKYQKPMPTEMKLFYNVQSGSFDAEYKYEPVFSDDSDKTSHDVVDEWFAAENR